MFEMNWVYTREHISDYFIIIKVYCVSLNEPSKRRLFIVHTAHIMIRIWKILITCIFNRTPGNTRGKCEPVDFDLTRIDHT